MTTYRLSYWRAQESDASVAAHLHYLRCAEAFSAAMDAARQDSRKIALARDALAQAQAQRAYWRAIDEGRLNRIGL